MKKSDPINCIRSEADQAQILRGRHNLKDIENEVNQLAAVLALAGNEVRLKILYLLNMEQELCPCDLADILQMSVPAVSQHLRKMRDGKLIISRKEGKTIFYSLESDVLKVLTPLLQHLQMPSNEKARI